MKSNLFPFTAFLILFLEIVTLEACKFENPLCATRIVIPACQKIIPDNFYSGCATLEQVVFEEGSQLETIGKNAFSGVSTLEFINIPDGTKTIGEKAFDGTGIHYMVIPSSVEEIGPYAFTNTPSLETVRFLPGSASIGSYAFSDLKLKSVLISKVDTIESFAFVGSSINTLTIAAAEKIDFQAFAFTEIPTINLGKVAEIGNQSFYRASEDVSTFRLIVAESQKIGFEAFSKVAINAVDINIQLKLVATIEEGAFNRTGEAVRNSVSVAITKCRHIEKDAFSHIASINQVQKAAIIIDSVDRIDEDSFENFAQGASKATIFIGSAKKIANHAFYNAMGKQVLFSNSDSAKLTIEESEEIGDYAFHSFGNKAKSVSVSLGKVGRVGYNAFAEVAYAGSEVEVSIDKAEKLDDNSFDSIGKEAYKLDISLGKIGSIGEEAFSDAATEKQSVVSLTIDSVGLIGSGAFENLAIYAKDLTISMDKALQISNSSFSNAGGRMFGNSVSLYIGESELIAKRAFFGFGLRSNFLNITFGDIGVIDDIAFFAGVDAEDLNVIDDNQPYGSVVILTAKSINEIRYQSFYELGYYSSKLNIDLGHVKKIHERAFFDAGNENFQEVTLEIASVDEIESEAFHYLGGNATFVDITIGGKTKSIGERSFVHVCYASDGSVCNLNIESVEFIGRSCFESFGENGKEVNINIGSALNILDNAFKYVALGDKIDAGNRPVVSIYIGESEFMGFQSFYQAASYSSSVNFTFGKIGVIQDEAFKNAASGYENSSLAEIVDALEAPEPVSPGPDIKPQHYAGIVHFTAKSIDEIGYHSFFEFGFLSSKLHIDLGHVKKIQDQAFFAAGLDNHGDVTLEIASVNNINEEAFLYLGTNAAFVNITIGGKTKKIEHSAFKYVCYATDGSVCLLNIESVEEIGPYAFENFGNSSKEVNVDIGSALNISGFAFSSVGRGDPSSGNHPEVTIFIGESEHIGFRSFLEAGCYAKFLNITLGEIGQIDDEAFYLAGSGDDDSNSGVSSNLYGHTVLFTAKSIKEVGYQSFYDFGDYSSKLHVKLGHVGKIHDEGFKALGQDNYGEVTLEIDSVNHIGYQGFYLFADDASVLNITIGKAKHIEDNAFENVCFGSYAVCTLSIESSETIGRYAFSNFGYAAKEINIDIGRALNISNYAFEDIGQGDVSNNPEVTIRIGESDYIGYQVFQYVGDHARFVNITLGDIGFIDEDAFQYNCYENKGAVCLLKIDTVDVIGYDSFYYFGYDASKIVIDIGKANIISDSAFYYAGYGDNGDPNDHFAGVDMTINIGKAKEISEKAFYYVANYGNSLTIDIGKNGNISDNAFYDACYYCLGDVSVKVQKSDSIGYLAFYSVGYTTVGSVKIELGEVGIIADSSFSYSGYSAENYEVSIKQTDVIQRYAFLYAGESSSNIKIDIGEVTDNIGFESFYAIGDITFGDVSVKIGKVGGEIESEAFYNVGYLAKNFFLSIGEVDVLRPNSFTYVAAKCNADSKVTVLIGSANTIENDAFYQSLCWRQTEDPYGYGEVTLKIDKVKHIHTAAFDEAMYTPETLSIEIGEVDTIESEAFHYLAQYSETVHIKIGSVENIHSHAFSESASHAYGKVSVEVGKYVSKIGDSAFYDWACNATADVSFKFHDIGKIKTSAFGQVGQRNTKSVTFQAHNIDEIGEQAFAYFGQNAPIVKVTVNNVKAIESKAFYSAGEYSSLFTFTANVIGTIGEEAFFESGLASISVSKVNKIGRKAFAQNSKLYQAVFKSLIEIDDHAFHQNEILQQLVLPADLKSIGNGAFAGSKKLKGLVFDEKVKLATNACPFEDCPCGGRHCKAFNLRSFPSKL